jgi:hypothetical protein
MQTGKQWNLHIESGAHASQPVVDVARNQTVGQCEHCVEVYNMYRECMFFPNTHPM